MLDNLGLIHMNGRVYDPLTGRFISADPYISDPDTPQTFNRYSYVNNNPLAYTDPSGYAGDTPFNSLWDPPGSQPSNDFVLKAQTGMGFQVVYDYQAGWLSPMQSAQSGMAGAPVTNMASSTPTQQNRQVFYSWNPTGRPFDDAGNPMVDKIEVTARKSTLQFDDRPLECAFICDMSDIVLGSFKLAGAAVGAIKSVGKSAVARASATGTRFVVNSAGEAQLVINGLRVGEHAALRMTERGVSIPALEKALSQTPFKYFHEGAWKTGFYDPGSRVFAGSINGELTTIINGVTPKYIDNLVKAVP
jgi:RHS repeat-associated protein